jgi:uncharacterized membrane protein YraQ (UPF0718 family)
MIVLGFTVLLLAIAAGLLFLAHHRADGTAQAGVREATGDFIHLMPRLAIGILGAGFIARAMPQDLVMQWLGPSSGFAGVSLAAVAGALTPGGPVVGFAIGAAALKSGAGMPQIMAFVTGWSLYTINRVLIWEVPTMPKRFVLIRMVASLPFPFIIAGITALIFNA